MNSLPKFPKKAALAAGAGVLLALLLLPGCKKAAKPPAPAPPKPAAAALAASTNSTTGTGTNFPAEFVSIFDDSPPPANKGRDPFNPDSTIRNPAPPPVTATTSSKGPVDPQLKLLGVVGSAGRRLAAINNQILALTDPPTAVRVPGGTVILKVVEIGEDYVDVMVEGTAGKKRLTMDQKK